MESNKDVDESAKSLHDKKRKVREDAVGIATKNKKLTCSTNGCKNKAYRVGGNCQKHGGRRLCSTDGCKNIIVKGGLCVNHGANKLEHVLKKHALTCATDGCNNKAYIEGGNCIKHGGKQLCSADGCNSYAKKGGVCVKHGAKRRKCNYEGCTNQVQKGRVCKRHEAKVKCSHEGCTSCVVVVNGKYFCTRHGVCHRVNLLKSLITAKDEEIASLKKSLKNSKPIDVVDSTDTTTTSKHSRTKDLGLAFQHEQQNKIIQVKEEKIAAETAKEAAEATLENVRMEKQVVESNLVDTRAALENVRGEKKLAEAAKEVAETTLDNMRGEKQAIETNLQEIETDLENVREQKEAAETNLRNVRARIDHANRMPKIISFQLKYEHTHCGICLSKFSADTDSKDEEIRKFLPVLSASKTCDHYFCHGCVLKRQATLAGEDGNVPKWIRCMHCRTITSFCPSEPKYHRLLIDMLKQAEWTAPQIKEEHNE